MLRRAVLIPLLAATVTFAGCANNTTFPEPDAIDQVYDVFVGSLDPLGRASQLFSLTSAGVVQASLVGVLVDNQQRSLDTEVLKIELGFFDGTDCIALDGAQTAPRFSAAVQRYYEAGTYCATVSDTVGLAQPVVFVARILSPAIVTTSGAAGTQTISSLITPNGRVTRTFEATKAGTATITLTSVSPSNAMSGIAIGVPDPTTNFCMLGRTVYAPPSSTPQISVPVEAGFYCAAVFDLGNYTGNQNFSMSITHP
jgi:hypothetical protein